eukprot:1168399-Prorocentrum_minimum.AAC.1
MEAALRAPPARVDHRLRKGNVRVKVLDRMTQGPVKGAAVRISPTGTSRQYRHVGSSEVSKRRAYACVYGVRVYVIRLLRFTGPPVPITARVHPTPRRMCMYVTCKRACDGARDADATPHSPLGRDTVTDWEGVMEATLLAGVRYSLTCTCTGYHPYGNTVPGGNPHECIEVEVEEGGMHLAIIPMVPIKVLCVLNS